MGFLSKQNNMLAVDIGTSSVKMALIEGSPKKVKTTFFNSVKLEISRQEDPEEEKLKKIEAIKSGLQSIKKKKIKRVMLTIPAQAVIARIISIPTIPVEKLDQMIGFEVEQHIPFPLNEVIYKYQLIRYDFENMEIFLAAIKQDRLDELLEIISSAGLEPEVINISSISLFNLYGYNTGLIDEKGKIKGDIDQTKSGSKPEGTEEETEEKGSETTGFADEGITTAIIDIGAGSTDISISEGRVLYFTRSTLLAGNSFTEAIQNKFNISFEKAEKLKKENFIMNLEDDISQEPAQALQQGKSFDSLFGSKPGLGKPGAGPGLAGLGKPSLGGGLGKPSLGGAGLGKPNLGGGGLKPGISPPTLGPSGDETVEPPGLGKPSLGSLKPPPGLGRPGLTPPGQNDTNSSGTGNSLGAAAAAAEFAAENSGEIDSNKIFSVVKPLLNRLVTELKRSFDYHKTQLNGKDIEKIILAGGASQLNGIDKFLNKKLGIEVEILNPIEKIEFGETENIHEFSTVIGLGLNNIFPSNILDINLIPDDIKLRRIKAKQKKNLIIFAALVGIFVLEIAGTMFLKYNQVSNDLDNLDKKEEQLRPILIQLQEFKETKQQVEKKLSIIKNIQNSRSNWLDILKDFSDHIKNTRELWIDKLTFNKKESVLISGFTVSYEMVSEFITQLREMKHLRLEERVVPNQDRVILNEKDYIQFSFSGTLIHHPEPEEEK